MAPNGSHTPKISEIWKFSEIRHIIVQSKGFFIANPIFEVLNKNYLILVMYDVIKITKKLQIYQKCGMLYIDQKDF